MELLFSIVAIVISLIAIINDRTSLHDQAYDRFSQLWLDMDQVFIDHPNMHKYFYKDRNGNYESITEESQDYLLAQCIAEKFEDIFQYTAPLEKYISNRDRKSYGRYKKMIRNSPGVKKTKQEW